MIVSATLSCTRPITTHLGAPDVERFSMPTELEAAGLVGSNGEVLEDAELCAAAQAQAQEDHRLRPYDTVVAVHVDVDQVYQALTSNEQ